ncbi:hypothetical protein GCM10028819_30350 [Spirosoma humi]
MQRNGLSRVGTCFHSEKVGLNLARADNKDTNDRTESLGVVASPLSDCAKNVVGSPLTADNKFMVNLGDNTFIVNGG